MKENQNGLYPESEYKDILLLLNQYMSDKDANIFLSNLQSLAENSNVKIQYVSNDFYNEQDAIKNIGDINNKLRIPGTFIYVSFRQLKENIIDVFSTLSHKLLKHLHYPVPDLSKLILTIILEILPQIVSCWHLVDKKERCIFIESIEFYVKDSSFHSIEEFKPKL